MLLVFRLGLCIGIGFLIWNKKCVIYKSNHKMHRVKRVKVVPTCTDKDIDECLGTDITMTHLCNILNEWFRTRTSKLDDCIRCLRQIYSNITRLDRSVRTKLYSIVFEWRFADANEALDFFQALLEQVGAIKDEPSVYIPLVIDSIRTQLTGYQGYQGTPLMVAFRLPLNNWEPHASTIESKSISLSLVGYPSMLSPVQIIRFPSTLQISEPAGGEEEDVISIDTKTSMNSELRNPIMLLKHKLNVMHLSVYMANDVIYTIADFLQAIQNAEQEIEGIATFGRISKCGEI